MNNRERMLATLEGRPPDRIPWIPRLLLWYTAKQRAGALPAEWADLSLREVEHALGVGTPARDGKVFRIVDEGVEEVTRREGIHEIASRSRGTPRIANRLLRRVRDWAQVHGQHIVDEEAALAALDLFDVDQQGLDRLDRAVLEALCKRFGGGPVGLSTLAVAVGEEPDTVETVAEPYLVREGYIVRTPRGRAASRTAWQHLGLTPPRTTGAQDQLPIDQPGRLDH